MIWAADHNTSRPPAHEAGELNAQTDVRFLCDIAVQLAAGRSISGVLLQAQPVTSGTIRESSVLDFPDTNHLGGFQRLPFAIAANNLDDHLGDSNRLRIGLDATHTHLLPASTRYISVEAKPPTKPDWRSVMPFMPHLLIIAIVVPMIAAYKTLLTLCEWTFCNPLTKWLMSAFARTQKTSGLRAIIGNPAVNKERSSANLHTLNGDDTIH